MGGLGSAAPGSLLPGLSLPRRSEVYSSRRLARPVRTRQLPEDPGDPAAGRYRPRESQFPEVGVPEVRRGKARAAMSAEAPAGWRPVAATPNLAQSRPGTATRNRLREGSVGPDFPGLEECTPSSTLQSLLPYLEPWASKGTPAPRPPSPGAGKNSAPRPLPLWGARVPQSPGAASGHDAGANWGRSEPVVGLGAPVPAALDPGSGGSVSPCGQTTQKAARRVFTRGT